MNFSEFQFEPSINQCLEKKGFESCTPIQEKSIPSVLLGSDLAGLAQTGTGKTAAYLLPIIDRILKSRKAAKNEGFTDKDWSLRTFPEWDESSFVLVLVPTRELADQVYQFCNEMIGDEELNAVTVYGGQSYDKQINKIKQGVDFIFATPGRLIDLNKQEKIIDLKQVKAIIFDEADRMFDMGFKDDMKYILNRIPKTRQFLIFSATLNFEVLNVAYSYGANPVEVDVSRDQLTTDNVTDGIFHIGKEEKPKYLLSLIKKEKPRQAIVFSNFKVAVERISVFLQKNGVQAMGISSLLSQSQRQRVIDKLKSKDEHYVLVATDVAARGLDIKEVDMVVNYELPDDAENYVHRIGRTGRAGAKGVAFSLSCESDVEALSRIQSYLDRKIDIEWMEDGELVADGDMVAMPQKVRTKNYKPSDNRNKNKSKSKRKRTHKGKSGQASSASSEKHRDKKTNRHKKQQAEFKGKKSSYKKKSSNKKQQTKNTSKKRVNKDKNFKKVYEGSKRVNTNKSIGGKVKSFFKGLFS